MKTENYDAVIVGGGLAGLAAALEARKSGLNTALLCKSRAGRSGNTLVSGASLSVVNGDRESGDSEALMEKDLLDSGAGISDTRLCSVFSMESGNAVRELRDYGVKFKEIDGKPLAKQPPGHSAARYFPSEYRNLPYTNRGLALTVPLVEKAAGDGISIRDRMTVVRLFTRNDRICGLLALDGNSGEPVFFRTGIVILAAGGGASLFAANNNTADVSCDSYGLAYEAGAVLRDMEMVQFYPSMMYEPFRVTISNPLFGDGAVMKNSLGEQFLFRYSDSGNRATRDVMARAAWREIVEGRGNPKYVFVDCSGIEKEKLEGRYGELAEILKKYGIDVSQDMLPVAPSAHFYLGGVVIDERCATSVRGLLACGEAAGGLHGANRLAGTALAEAFVFGKRAGRTAAEIFRITPDAPPAPDEEMRFPEFRDGIPVSELTESLRNCMWRSASIIRNRDSLEKARQEVDRIGSLRGEAGIRNAREIVDHFSLNSMIAAARMLISCSMLREETRGAFCREEFPEATERFKGSFFAAKNTDGEMGFRFVKNSG